MSLNSNPFEALGLPERPDLTDEDVRAAWRRVAAATHPDRPDGGDLARYTAASAAYAELRTPWGRSEAYADLAERNDGPVTSPIPPIPGDDEPLPPPWQPLLALVHLPARVRRGRPALLALRIAIAAGISAAAFAVAGAQPAAAGLAAGALTWLVLTARRDLMAPGTAHARSYLVRSGRG